MPLKQTERKRGIKSLKGILRLTHHFGWYICHKTVLLELSTSLEGDPKGFKMVNKTPRKIF